MDAHMKHMHTATDLAVCAELKIGGHILVSDELKIGRHKLVSDD
jgi:hypothetical protein